MQDNAPSHVSKTSRTWLEAKGFSGGRIMQWPANSPDLNPIENLWAIIKREIYKNGMQFHTNDDLWRAIEVASKDISRTTFRNLTESMDRRLIQVIEKKEAISSIEL